MTYAAMWVAGLVVGGLVAWAWASRGAVAAEATARALREQQAKNEEDLAVLRGKLQAEQSGRTAAETALQAERQSLVEQRALLHEAESRLKDVFRALAGEILNTQSHSFLQLAEEKFKGLRSQAGDDLTQRQEAIQG